MDNILNRILMTAITLFVTGAVIYFLCSQVIRYTRGNRFRQSRGKLANKILIAFLLGIAAVVLVFIWGINARHLWALLTGVFGIIAIGFFAVWSLLSNIIAGFLIFISNPFKIGDVIKIIPDNISGTVLELKLFFVVLESEGGDIIHIPNNMLFQRIVVRPASVATTDYDDVS